MKRNLKFLMAILVALMLVVTTACGADNEPKNNDPVNNNNAEENADNNADNNAAAEENNAEDNANNNEENEEVADATPIFHVENAEISEGNYVDLGEHLDTLKGLDEGTIAVKFNYTGDSLMSLFSVSNDEHASEHFHLYIMPTAFGSENRADDENTHINSPDTLVDAGVDNTIVMVVSKDDGYKLFLNGELKKEDTTSGVKFLSNISNATSAQLGRTERGVDDNGEVGNPYPFEGTIEFAEVYSDVLTDAQVAEISAK